MGGKWNRKRKDRDKRNHEAARKKKEPIQEENELNNNTRVVTSSFHYDKFNWKMESYYAFQGLHSIRRIRDDEEDDKQSSIQRRQDFVPCRSNEEMEEERKKWKDILAITLPASFRIAQNQEQDLRDRIERELNAFMGTEFEVTVNNSNERQEGKGDDTSSEATVTIKMAPVKRIPFIPHAYQLSIDRRTISRDPLLQSFHSWLMMNCDAGFLSRLETVSMIPPVVLKPQPHHHILDMCAAPGSKTGFLLEMIGNPTQDGTQEPTGFVVANDSDHKRAYMMVNQLKRINSPALFITAEDAQRWPLLMNKKLASLEEQAIEGFFDRVLCDVPCSGDGTTRKNAGIWKKWSALQGLTLHPLQLSIALNGVKLTKVGGYMCYSTCSMNPVENEAVVAAVLRSADGALELVDRRPDLPGILARDGMSTWKVLSESILPPSKDKSQIYSKRKGKINHPKAPGDNDDEFTPTKHYDEDMKMNPVDPSTVHDKVDDVYAAATDIHSLDAQATEQVKWVYEPLTWDHDYLLQRAQSTGLIWYKSFDDVPETLQRRVRSSCFSPSQEEIDKYNLHKCLRILPHDMNTGGFFVALFRKVAPLSSRAKRIAEDLEKSLSENIHDLSHLMVMSDEADVNPAPRSISDKDIPIQIKGMGTEYFVAVPGHILPPLIDYYGLSEDFPQDQIFYRNNSDAKILYFVTASIKKNLIDRGAQERVTMITSGLRVFDYSKLDSDGLCYRPVQEGVHYIVPYMTKRKIILDSDAFELCLAPGRISICNFPSNTANEIRALSVGSFVVALKGFENNKRKKMFVTLWRCRGDVINCLVNKHDMEGLKSKLNAVREVNKE